MSPCVCQPHVPLPHITTLMGTTWTPEFTRVLKHLCCFGCRYFKRHKYKQWGPHGVSVSRQLLALKMLLWVHLTCYPTPGRWTIFCGVSAHLACPLPKQGHPGASASPGAVMVESICRRALCTTVRTVPGQRASPEGQERWLYYLRYVLREHGDVPSLTCRGRGRQGRGGQMRTCWESFEMLFCSQSSLTPGRQPERDTRGPKTRPLKDCALSRDPPTPDLSHGASRKVQGHSGPQL